VSRACVQGFLGTGLATKHAPVAAGGDRYGAGVMFAGRRGGRPLRGWRDARWRCYSMGLVAELCARMVCVSMETHANEVVRVAT